MSVLLFGRLGDAVGQDEIRVELNSGATCEDLRVTIAERFPDLADHLFKPRTSVAINKTIVPWSSTLKAADEIAILPPVTGG